MRDGETAPRRPAGDAAPLIEIDGLQVHYGDCPALGGLSLAVGAGEIVGLLGPNGAGKTTALSVLATLRRPSAGSARVAGWEVARNPGAVRRVLGLAPQAVAVYPTLTARENLHFFGRLLGLRRSALRTRVADALDLAGLAERADHTVATFSGGMQRRLNLACAVLHRPRVLLLDEPTVGVDPQSRERIFGAVRAQADAGTGVLYSTHYMEEAERLCDRVVLIDYGRTVASGTPAALVRGAARTLRLRLTTRRRLEPGWLDGIRGARASEPTPGSDREPGGTMIEVAVDDATIATAVLERAAALGGDVVELHLQQPNLQDVFLALTGRALRD